MSGRVVPSRPAGADGYTTWHNDKERSDNWENPTYRVVKLFLALWDVPRDGGETAVVAGTHRLPTDPAEMLENGLFRSLLAPYPGDALRQSCMPNLIRATLPAGAAFLFDSSV